MSVHCAEFYADLGKCQEVGRDGTWLVQSQAPDSLDTDFAEGTELFRHSTEKTVLSVYSVYKKMGLSSDFATAIREGRRGGIAR